MSTIRIPEPYSSSVDRVCDSDRRYFEDHPEASSFMRAAVPGEFYPETFNCRFVVVRKLLPGMRAREPLLEGER